MVITHISLKNFRNIKNISLNPDSGTNIFCGDNAQGKTNIMEAVFMCATGRSHRTHIEKELITFGMDDAHIRMICQKDNYSDRIDIHIKNSAKKGVALNGTAIKKLGELFGTVNVVFFCPEDLNLVKEGPNMRRKFMDIEMCQTSSVYYYNLQQYYKALRQRNELLKSPGNTDASLIDVWDEQLINYGTRIVSARREFISVLDKKAAVIHSDITQGRESLCVEYKPSADEYNFRDKIKNNYERDIRFGTTHSGIHKDDVLFLINGVNARSYGSQGQQRTVCLSLKLAEVEIIKDKAGSYPVLLLDDVLSELDRNRQSYIISNLKNIQTFITCTGIDEVISSVAKKSRVYNVCGGNVKIV